MKKRTLSLLVIACLALVLVALPLMAACAEPAPPPPPTPTPTPTPTPPEEEWPERLAWLSGPVGGAWYAQNVPIADLVSKEIGIPIEVAMAPTGPSHNIRLDKGEVHIMHQSSASIADMHLQRHAFEEMPRITSIRSLFFGNAGAFMMIARADTGIKSVPDTKDKRCKIDYKPAPPIGRMMEANLESWGMTKDDVIWQSTSSMPEVATALIEGTSDVGFGSMVTKPTSWWLDLTSQIDLVYLSPNMETIGEIMAQPKCAGFVIRSFEAGSFKGMTEKTYGIGTCNAAYGRYDLPDDLVYEFVKALWDNIDKLKSEHPGPFIDYDINKATFTADWFPPYHAGAIKYYQEKGVWGKEQEEFQKKQLSLYGMSK